MFMSMSIVVFKMIALVFKCVERFVFDFPSPSAGSHHLVDIRFSQEEGSDPGEFLDFAVLIMLFVVEEVVSGF